MSQFSKWHLKVIFFLFSFIHHLCHHFVSHSMMRVSEGCYISREPHQQLCHSLFSLSLLIYNTLNTYWNSFAIIFPTIDDIIKEKHNSTFTGSTMLKWKFIHNVNYKVFLLITLNGGVSSVSQGEMITFHTTHKKTKKVIRTELSYLGVSKSWLILMAKLSEEVN